MRLSVFAIAILATALVLPAAADDRANVDLVAKFALGAADGATLGTPGTALTATVTRTSAGVFEGGADANSFAFVVTDKGNCLFDIVATQAGQVLGGIEIDAARLKSVTYNKTGEHDGISEYAIALVGAEGVVQLLGPDGQTAPTAANSVLATSLGADEMQAAVTALQAGACPAAA